MLERVQSGAWEMTVRVHLIFCKYILGLNRSTPNCFTCRELGRFPADLQIKNTIVAYWSSVMKSTKDFKLTTLMLKTNQTIIRSIGQSVLNHIFNHYLQHSLPCDIQMSVIPHSLSSFYLI